VSDARGKLERTDAAAAAAGASPVVDERRQAWVVWLIGSAFVLTLLVLFYPRTTVSVDEERYLAMAGYLMRGQAFDRSSEAWFWKPRPDGIHFDRTVYSLSPLCSALLIPFVKAGWRSSCLLGTVAHVLAFGGMIYVLRRRGLSPLWAMLYLLYPTSILYSRMIMVDVPSSALVVLMLVLLHRERPNYFVAGLVMGLAILLKLSNLPVIGMFALVTFVEDLMPRRSGSASGADAPRFRWFWMGLGMLPGLLVLATINTIFFNGPFSNGYMGIAGGYFRWTYFVRYLPFYVKSLMTMYPLMLITPLFLRGRYRREMGLSCLASLIFFSAYYTMDQGNTWYEYMVRGLRFQLIVVPFYTIAYAEASTRLAEKLHLRRLVRPALATAVVLLCAGAAVISRQFFEHTVRESDRQVQLDSMLPSSGTVVVGLNAAKYVKAVAHPELKVLRLIGPAELPFVVRTKDLPVLLVVVRGEVVRTEALRKPYEDECVGVLKKANECFVVRPYDRSVGGFEMRILERRVREPGTLRTWLPWSPSPETNP